MAKKLERSTKVTGLRRQAEARLRMTNREVAALPIKDVQQLVHELQVHQIELDLQNDELCRTQLEFEAVRDRYMDLYDFSPAGHMTLDTHGKIVEANLGAGTLLGLTRNKLIGQPLARFIAPRDEGTFHRHCQQVLKTGARQTCEVLLRIATGVPHWIHFESLAVHDGPGSITHWRVALLDITERKLAEARLRDTLEEVRTLSGRLTTVQEEERTRIARELHDELGVRLTCLKIDLSRLHTMMSEGAGVGAPIKAGEKIRSMVEQVDTTIASVQRLVTELRPAVLDDLGLVAAIEWQCQDFQKRTGIPCTCLTSADDIAMGPAATTALFRICQEALTNVARHARATAATVKLELRNDFLQLVVADNGLGIPDTKVSDRQSLGLLGMRERVAQFGGETTIQGHPGTGTTVTACLPRSLSRT